MSLPLRSSANDRRNLSSEPIHTAIAIRVQPITEKNEYPVFLGVNPHDSPGESSMTKMA